MATFVLYSCAGIPLNPKTVKDIESDEYYYGSKTYDLSLDALKKNILSYRNKCKISWASYSNLYIQDDSDSLGVIVLYAEPGNVILVAKLYTSKRGDGTDVKMWSKNWRLAEAVFYAIDNGVCIETTWDSNLHKNNNLQK